MNIARSSLLRFLADGLGMAVKMLGLFYFARVLGPAAIGIFFLFQAVTGAASALTDFDISDAVSKRISEGGDIDTLFWTAFVLKSAPLLAVSISIYLFQNSINSFLGAELALLLVAQIVLGNAAKLILQVLHGELRVGETALPSLARHVVFVGSGIVFLRLGLGVVGLVYGLLLGSVVRIGIGLYRTSIGVGKPSLEHAQSLFDFFKYSFATSVSRYIFQWTDVLLIGVILTQTDVGIYEIPWRVTALVLLLSNSLGMTIFPQISEWDQKDRSSRIENLLTGTLAVSLFLVVPAFFGVLLLGRDILLFGFGPGYVTGWVVLIIVAFIRIVEAIDVVFRESLRAINRQRLSAYAEVFSVAFNIVLNVIFIYQFGILGAAVASAVSIGLKMGVNGAFLGRFVELAFPYRRTGAILLASAAMATVVWGIQYLIAVRTIWHLFAIVGLGVLVYLGVALTIQPLRTMIVENVQRLTG